MRKNKVLKALAHLGEDLDMYYDRRGGSWVFYGPLTYSWAQTRTHIARLSDLNLQQWIALGEQMSKNLI